MQWIKYQVLQNIIDEEEILIEKKVGYSEANLAIAKTEAYNSEYTIEEDEESYEKEPLAVELGGTGAQSKEDVIKNLDILSLACSIPIGENKDLNYTDNLFLIMVLQLLEYIHF